MLITVERIASHKPSRGYIDLPYALYGKDPNWVPALRSAEWKMFGEKTAFFAQATMGLFVAERSGVKGRGPGRRRWQELRLCLLKTRTCW